MYRHIILLLLCFCGCVVEQRKPIMLRGPAPLSLQAQETTLVPGTTMTYTNGIYTWAGNPFCAEAGFLLSPESPAIDTGVRTEVHCPVAGSGVNQLEGCLEWYGAAPDIGGCEYVGGVPVPPLPPNDFPVVLNSSLGQPPEEKTIIYNVSKPAGVTTVTVTMNVNDGEQCDEGKLYINGNGPVQLWRDDPTYSPDAADPCYMTSRNGVDATASIKSNVDWWNDGDNQIRFVHDKVSSSGFVVNYINVGFGVTPPPQRPTGLLVH